MTDQTLHRDQADDETKTFHVGDILSITDGHLVSPRHVDGVYDILNWVTRDNLFTHQLPRASREAEPFLRKQFPELAAVEFPADLDSEASIWAWLAEVVAAHGETREVPRMPTDDHTRIDPLTELLQMRPDMPVVGVVVDEEATDG